MNKTEIATLAINDKVGVGYLGYRDHGPRMIRIGEVSKINGHGHITVKFETGGDIVFKADGFEKGRDRGGHYLVEYDKALNNNDRVRQQANVDIRCKAIIKRLEDGKNGYGNYKITREDLERIADLMRDWPVVPE